MINPSWTKRASNGLWSTIARSEKYNSSCGEVLWISCTSAMYVHVLWDFRQLALHRFVTCPSSLTSSGLLFVSKRVRKCSYWIATVWFQKQLRVHKVFEIVDEFLNLRDQYVNRVGVLHRVCDQDVSGQVSCCAKMT